MGCKLRRTYIASLTTVLQIQDCDCFMVEILLGVARSKHFSLSCYLSLPALLLPVLTARTLPNNLHLYQQCCWYSCCMSYIFGLQSLLRESMWEPHSPFLPCNYCMFLMFAGRIGWVSSLRLTLPQTEITRLGSQTIPVWRHSFTLIHALLSRCLGTCNKNLTCIAWQLNNDTEFILNVRSYMLSVQTLEVKFSDVSSKMYIMWP
jgi:hypothetical protein